MIYRVYKENLRTGNMVKHGDYKVLEEAEKTIKNLISRNKRRSVDIIKIPENIGVGYEVYLSNGELYGTITRETKSFYYLEPSNKKIIDELQRPLFLKENFQEKFERGIFKAVDGDPEKVQKYEAKLEENSLEFLDEDDEDEE